jgi:hypothetical protein
MAVNIRAVLLLESNMATVPDTYTCTRPLGFFDVHAQVTTQGVVDDATVVERQAGGAGGFNAASGVMTETNGAVGTLVRVASMVTAQDVWVPTDVIRVNHAVGNTVRANHYLAIIPRPITGA